MFKVVFLQIGATIITVAIAGYTVGLRGAVSAALGGVACFLPNLLFALRLTIVSRKHGASYVTEFFVGEAIKIASTIGLLALSQVLYRDLHWLAWLAGLVAALQAGFFAFMLKMNNHGNR